MPKSRNRPNTKLHCQHCGQKRSMIQFFAINTEQKDGEKNVYPFNLRRFLDLIKSDAMIRLPKFYTAVCGVCFKETYYQGTNHGKSIVVIPT